jgi:hypothetical protein
LTKKIKKKNRKATKKEKRVSITRYLKRVREIVRLLRAGIERFIAAP